MKQIITDETGYKNIVINLRDLDIDIKIKYILYSVIDAFINKITDDDLKKYFNVNKQYITLEELAEIYKIRDWYKYDGFPGIIFERFVYNILVIREYESLNSFVLNCLNKLDTYSGDDFDIILWGTEKGAWINDFVLNNNLNIIDNRDCILINKIFYPFKDVLKNLYHSNTKYGGLEKADLFIKLKNSNRWFGVDVKLDIELFKEQYRHILPIRVALRNTKIPRLKKSVFGKIDDYTFIFDKENDYGELSVRYYRYMFLLLENIAKNNKYNINKELYEFNTELTLFFLENKKMSLFRILDLFARDFLSKGVKLPERMTIKNTCNTFLINGYDYSYLDEKNRENRVSIG